MHGCVARLEPVAAAFNKSLDQALTPECFSSGAPGRALEKKRAIPG